MFKVLWLMKRKDGTSMDDLINYYENHHSVLAKKLWDQKFRPLKYMRKYFRPISHLLPFADTLSGADFDLAMEMWFESPEHFTQMLEVCSPEEIWKTIIEDENRFLDPHKRAIFVLEEHETKFD